MLKWKWRDNHFDNKAQFTTRNATPKNKQQVSKSFSIFNSHKLHRKTLTRSAKHLFKFINNKCAMPWDAMSNIVMHVFLNDTHPLSLSPGPMGDISIHASVAAHDTTLDNSNHRSARYIPRNIIFIAARDMTLEMIHPYTTIMSQIQCNWHAQMKMRR